ALRRVRRASVLLLLEVCVCVFYPSRRRYARLVSDWSSDVCASDLGRRDATIPVASRRQRDLQPLRQLLERQPPAKVVLLQPSRRLVPVAIADQRHRRQGYPAQRLGGGPTISQP